MTQHVARVQVWFVSHSSSNPPLSKLSQNTQIGKNHNKLNIHLHIAASHLGPDLVFLLDEPEPLSGDRLDLGADKLVDELEPLLVGPPCGGAPECVQLSSPSPTVATLDCTRILLVFFICICWFNLHVLSELVRLRLRHRTFPHSRGASGCVDTMTHDQTTRTFGLKCCHTTLCL